MSEPSLQDVLAELADCRFSPLDLLPEEDLAEKLVALSLSGSPPAPPALAGRLSCLAKQLRGQDTSELKVVIFGGGTGLSNIIGGDSRNPLWPRSPFRGLKEVFPQTTAVVCITDDGGSTGELLKDLPLIALGDLRHVLLSAVRQEKLQKQYGLAEHESGRIVSALHQLFNYRFNIRPSGVENLLSGAGVSLDSLPEFMGRTLYWLLDELFSNALFEQQLGRPHCLGNLLLAAAIYQHNEQKDQTEVEVMPPEVVLGGIRFLADLLGANQDAVLPCVTSPAFLKILYGNGVLVTGEHKSGHARRGYPMDRVFVEFHGQPHVPTEVLSAVEAADIILFAPGSLFTSIVPILQVPGITEAIRKNEAAMKMLVANLWIQTGETDITKEDPRRRFHVSDLINAYHRNIPGGVEGLFEQVLVLGLRDIPGSILQNYALENKVPIYLDRERVKEMGFAPVEARLYSQDDIDERRVIQHDAASVAQAVKTLWGIRTMLPQDENKHLAPSTCRYELLVHPTGQTPNGRQKQIEARLTELDIDQRINGVLSEIFWRHWDVPVEHLAYVKGISLLGPEEWSRCQEWDNVMSFYDPKDCYIKIREDVLVEPMRFEVGLLIALGQSLLGNYAVEKTKLPVERDGDILGYEFRLTLQPEEKLESFFTTEQLDHYLGLVRMWRSALNPRMYTRLVNSDEGFTPPGLLLGLSYAWYLDNRFACHIEYKMSISRMAPCDLIPEQKKIAQRRKTLTDFMRSEVFGYKDPLFQP